MLVGWWLFAVVDNWCMSNVVCWLLCAVARGCVVLAVARFVFGVVCCCLLVWIVASCSWCVVRCAMPVVHWRCLLFVGYCVTLCVVSCLLMFVV